MLTPEIGLIFWTTIAFGVLFFVLSKYAWKPILKSVNDRESSIKDALDQAEKARLEMENLQADNERILKEARAEREAMLKEARELKAKMIADAKDEAQTQASKMIEQAQTAIEGEKKAAMAELKSHVAGLAVDIAEKVVRDELSNKDKQIQLVESMLGDAALN
ncbi:MAG: F0F1 ATP synthase subunit B [Bacteroidia bacterium]|nr:F0F1 ATP synthase subunit B [Bacteroidia bacterium]NND25686.1 F0F1 ATP synthase subunit B [Flavobacteriaceae bacterium]MBT8279248.1 F0F1 ATP synthase subunit B [Bacteroidia bacterium]NNK59784.1 F0F1 ATP synthase subunit B [Flavobacteriaceae bacterium]NNL32048.1 F0F1 ATP synthase subunit B [Flavobacteriaceae bacterium]